MTEYYIGVDSGTQGSKAVVVDGVSGRVVEAASKRYSLIEGLHPGYKEQHPSTWVGALVVILGFYNGFEGLPVYEGLYLGEFVARFLDSLVAFSGHIDFAGVHAC